MAFRVTCPGCSRSFTIPESSAGKWGRCRVCGLVFPLGGNRDAPEAESARDDPQRHEGGAAASEFLRPSSSRGGRMRRFRLGHAIPVFVLGFLACLAVWAILVCVRNWAHNGQTNEAVDRAENPTPVRDDLKIAPSDPARPDTTELDHTDFPALPPPRANGYPSGTSQRPQVPLIRRDVVDDHASQVRQGLEQLRELHAAVRGIRDQESLESFASIADPISERIHSLRVRALGLTRLNPSELEELKRMLGGDLREIMGRLRKATQSLPGVPAKAGNPPSGPRVNRDDAARARGLVDRLATRVEEFFSAPTEGAGFMPAGKTVPYVEVYVDGVETGELHAAIGRFLSSLSDGQTTHGELSAVWSANQKRSSFRIAPVEDIRVFAGAIPFGACTVQGHQLIITSIDLDHFEPARQRGDAVGR